MAGPDVSTDEIVDILGVSRQRVDEIARTHAVPEAPSRSSMPAASGGVARVEQRAKRTSRRIE